MVRNPSFASLKSHVPLVNGKQRLLPGVLYFQLTISSPEHFKVPFGKIGPGLGSCCTNVFDSTVSGYN